MTVNYRDRMAHWADRFSDNVPGSWYVDAHCINCHLCEDLAPGVFRLAPGGGHRFVYRQPATRDDLLDAEEARESCPVEAIGSNGAGA